MKHRIFKLDDADPFWNNCMLADYLALYLKEWSITPVRRLEPQIDELPEPDIILEDRNVS